MRFERSLLILLAAAALPSAGHATRAMGPRTLRVSTKPPAVCFGPGTDPAYIDSVYQSLELDALQPQLFQFIDGDRWFRTATDGTGLQLGEPTILTWSVVPDGTNIPSGGFTGDVAGPSNLRARLNSIYGSEGVWRPIIQQALDEWASETGTSYVFAANDDGAAFASTSSEGAQGVLGTRGDLRLSGRNIDGNSGVLAFNWFPDSGDMVIDTNDSFYLDVSNSSLRLRNVVSHEHGHGLGFRHVCPISQTKLMEPIFASNFVGPQHDDILAGNRGYGDDREDNDVAALGTNFGSITNGVFSINGASIDRVGDLDFFRFTVTSGKQVDVTVTPVGFTYSSGPQQGSQCPAGPNFNSLAQNDLILQVLSTNGTTILASANNLPAGGAETLSNVVLPGSGQFFIRVAGGSFDAAQLYNLSFTIENQQLADLAITKTDGQSTAVPGQTVTYAIVVSNLSTLASVTGVTVADTFPAALTGVSWTCTASAGSNCIVGAGNGNINRTVDLLPSGSVTFTATGTVAPGAVGTLVNTATVTPPVGSPDPVAANNTATDTDTLTPQADLSITKTDGQPSIVPGTPVVYTIVASNPGPSTATGATVTDAFAASLSGSVWGCVPSAGSSCAVPSGSGNISTAVTLLPGGTATFTAAANIDPGATGSLVNTATIAAPASLTDGNPANNTATDTDTLTPVADVSVSKTDNQTTAVPGSAVTYSIGAFNAGPSASGSVTLTDTFPASITGVTWTCAASPGSTCPASGSGNIAAAVTMAPGSGVTFTATGTIGPSATGSLTNTASASVPGGVTDPGAGNNSATDTDTLTPQADFGITKTDNQLVATPGAGINYQIVVTQGGPSNSPAATVTDVFPSEVIGVNWSCTASAGSTCTASGGGNINASVTLLPGGTATFSATGTVDPSASGSLSNTASVAAPGAVTDPLTGNNSDTDTDNISLDLTELTHGSKLVRDLRPAGVVPADHYYWLSQKPYSSYEATVDGTSGDVGPTLVLQRLAGDGATVLQQSTGASPLGFSRSLRFANDRPVVEDGQLLRVRSGGCGSDCGADDVYRLRLRETTGRIPRFNNSTTQITVAILQNLSSSGPLSGTLYFWRANGTVAASQPFTLAARAAMVLNTSSIPGLAGTSGSVTVTHDGGYGGLVGKTVALEPATGFSFDSPLVLVAP
jgi:uncharacterized repeat protein (TIGR01451 family)